MTTSRKTKAGLGLLSWAAVALLAAGCGTQRAENPAEAYRRTHPTPTGISTPSTPKDYRCPGESPRSTPPTAATTSGSTVPPTDHYAENHGFRNPLPLHGKSRCEGLAAVGRIKTALEPLRRRGDFAPDRVRGALTGLGYSTDKVRAYQDGSAGVGFLIDIGASPWCVEGTMGRNFTKADAFGGYPDGTGCEPPSGGH
ncbi:hypothetical protein [Streptomyces sp. NRRL S-1022]|uniref:hypothetical protein n=1 Tax=Streptomyces sp. NRRL S-1022 TaxID=1463880 RepID=UPI000560BE84|nr:hypothetical protein [Streptomyces sp. NRRL S-1022]